MGSRRLLGLRRTAARLSAAAPDPEFLEEVADEEAAAAAAMERLLRNQEKAARERRMRRMMEPPGPPERTLTRQAMEQIRFLYRELPEEWPVARLAEGFQVQPDVICRVLKSRFVPSPERASKQDARALGRWRLQKEGGQLETALTQEATFRVLLPQPVSDLPVPVAAQGKPKQEGRRTPASSKEEEEEEAQTGQILSLEKLEELAAKDWHKHNPAWVPVQKGWEFFDPEGNLLYKVPVGHPEAGKDSQ